MADQKKAPAGGLARDFLSIKLLSQIELYGFGAAQLIDFGGRA